MKPVGIIANPRSGKDIRRLVAYGSVFDNFEKVNILKRVFLALDAMGIKEVVIMPDSFGMSHQALDDIDVALKPIYLEMEIDDNQEDSTRAAKLMAERGVACILTLGGDGTNRAVAKTCGDFPLLPVSTGTNNVFPYMIEGTLAGIAAGVVASEKINEKEIGVRMPQLEIYRGSALLDIALVDVVVSNHEFIGSRAICDVSTILEIFLTRAASNQIGFSAVGGFLNPFRANSSKGMHIVVGEGQQRVLAPIAPGLIRWLPIKSCKAFSTGDAIPISTTPAVLALDGEREHYIGKNDKLKVRFNANGPSVVNIDGVMQAAQKRQMFLEDQHQRN